MKCPTCSKGEIAMETNLGGYIFKRIKRITYYCPLCPYKNVKNFKLNEAEYQAELAKIGGEYY